MLTVVLLAALAASLARNLRQIIAARLDDYERCLESESLDEEAVEDAPEEGLGVKWDSRGHPFPFGRPRPHLVSSRAS